jgi:hypothetical protein
METVGHGCYPAGGAGVKSATNAQHTRAGKPDGGVVMSTTTSRTSRAGTVPTRQQLDELDALLQRMLELPVQPADTPPPVIPPRPAPRPPEARPPLASTPRPAPRTPEPPRSYPPSYMVVEDAGPPLDTPIPGGRHDLAEVLPGDPVQEQAQARLRESAPDPLPFESSWQPSAQTWGPLAESWRQTQPMHPTPASPSIPVYVPPPTNAPSVWTQTVVLSDAPSSAEMPAAAAPATEPAPVPRPDTPVVLWPLVAFNAFFDVFLWLLGPLGSWLRGPSGGKVFATIGVLGLIGAAAVAALDLFGWNW